MAIATYLSCGESVDYTPGSDVAAGDVIDLGACVGIAKRPIAANTLGQLHLHGIFRINKYSGEAISQFDLIYWDAGTSTATKTVGYSEARMGIAAAAAVAGDTTVDVLLMPTPA